MRKRTIILLLITFAAAAWCAAQVSSQSGDAALPPDPARHANVNAVVIPSGSAGSPGSQPDGLAFAQRMLAPLTAERCDEVLEFLRTEEPALFGRLQEVRRGAPVRFTAMVQQVAERVESLMALKSDNPALYALYKEEMNVSRQIERLRATITANNDPSRQSELVAQLRIQITARFDLVQERQRLLIIQSRLRIDRMQALLEARQNNRDKTIEQQVQQIIDQAASEHDARAKVGLPAAANAPASQPQR